MFAYASHLMIRMTLSLLFTVTLSATCLASSLLISSSDSLEGAREHILRSGEEGFDNVHQKLVQRLDAGRVKDKAFLEKVSGVAEILSAPMADEKVETTVLKNGKRVVQIVEIGKRIADFKKNIGNEEEKLDDYWKRYELLQLEFEELGVQVLGARALKVAEDKYDEEGYRHEVDLLEKEHCTKMEEIMEELGEIGDEAIKKMRASEKVRLRYTTRRNITLRILTCFL
ncbi:hypothetical protein ACMFMF_007274 [Clarireedia jacksonii]